MNDATTVGLDLAKQHFSICIMDAHGRIKSRHELKRPALAAFLQTLPQHTVIAMEACSSAHHWGGGCACHLA